MPTNIWATQKEDISMDNVYYILHVAGVGGGGGRHGKLLYMRQLLISTWPWPLLGARQHAVNHLLSWAETFCKLQQICTTVDVFAHGLAACACRACQFLGNAVLQQQQKIPAAKSWRPWTFIAGKELKQFTVVCLGSVFPAVCNEIASHYNEMACEIIVSHFS